MSDKSYRDIKIALIFGAVLIVFGVIPGVLRNRSDDMTAAVGDTISSSKNTLCIYNKNTQISTDICAYYASRRPDKVVTLALDIPDSAYIDPTVSFYGSLRENMSDANFAKYISGPISDFVGAHPEAKITHIAAAKDIPIKITSADGNTVILSANKFLNFNATENTSASDVLNAFSSGQSCLQSLHFDPDQCQANSSGLKYRYAVSYLSAFTLNDVKKIIDKALAPAPNVSSVKWVLDLNSAETMAKQYSGFLGHAKNASWYLMVKGVNGSNIIKRTSDVAPFVMDGTIVAYGGMGSHHVGYPPSWVNSSVRGTVANRAIIDVYESFFGMSASSGSDSYGYQGKVAQAFKPDAFGGSNYSGSFSGGVGTVYEPSAGGVVRFDDLFPAYASGKTFAEAFLSSSAGTRFGIAFGDPLMTLEDYPSLRALSSYESLTPTVSAGEDQAIESENFPVTVDLNGLVSNDNLPTVQWMKMGGPGSVTFEDMRSPVTKAIISQVGDYELRLTTNSSNGIPTPAVIVYDTVNIRVVSGEAGAGDVSAAEMLPSPINFRASPPSSCIVSGNVPQISLSWSPADSGQAPSHYDLTIDGGAPIAITGTSYVHKPVQPGSSHSYTLQAVRDGFIPSAKVIAHALVSSACSVVNQAVETTLPTTPPVANLAPVISIGAGQTIEWPSNLIMLDSNVTDDGLPAGSRVSVSWNAIDPKPSAVSIDCPSCGRTKATFGSPGSYTLKLTASDGSRSSSASVAIKINSDMTAPVRTEGLPAGTLSYALKSTNISLKTNEQASCRWNASANTAYEQMGGSFTSSNGINHSASVNISPDKTYSYYIKCKDLGENANTSDYPIMFSVSKDPAIAARDEDNIPVSDTIQPTVSVSQPTNGDIISEGQTFFAVAVTDNVGVAGVQYYLNGTKINSESVSSPWKTTIVLVPGTYKLYAVARDASNNKSTSPVVSFTVKKRYQSLSAVAQITQPQAVPPAGSRSNVTDTGAPRQIPINVKEIARNLKLNDQGEDVRLLQKTLNTLGYTIASQGAGSPGMETTYFNKDTADALKEYQESMFEAGLEATGDLDNVTLVLINSEAEKLFKTEKQVQMEAKKTDIAEERGFSSLDSAVSFVKYVAARIGNGFESFLRLLKII